MSGTSDEITAKLVDGWTKSNNKLKAQWAQQVANDETAAQAAEVACQKTINEEATVAAKIAEEERLAAEKEKPKLRLGDLNMNSAGPSFIESRTSPYAQNKLEKMEYCLLYCFCPRGLNDADTTSLSSYDDISSVRLTQNGDNQLGVLTGPSSVSSHFAEEDKVITTSMVTVAIHRTGLAHGVAGLQRGRRRLPCHSSVKDLHGCGASCSGRSSKAEGQFIRRQHSLTGKVTGPPRH
ncbi:hypothetical protein DFH07DRAFT_966970 [Mycena maculata]|uniref:Uncharacterized protein n=1 Tax=Mycena maculata TaxID=230809 RepID=A0AAD7I670_9AGAR|nr:hypothetical protein DFH07DRAFT_966970 [Mycena maculata]